MFFYPYIAHEWIAQNLILSVHSLRFALCLKERHRSQNEGSLKSEERLSNFKERCAQLWHLLCIIFTISNKHIVLSFILQHVLYCALVYLSKMKIFKRIKNLLISEDLGHLQWQYHSGKYKKILSLINTVKENNFFNI